MPPPTHTPAATPAATRLRDDWLPCAVLWYEARVLCLGLDGAGKTSVLQRAADRSDSAPVAPTTGFIVKTLTLPPDWKVDVWDIGGAATLALTPTLTLAQPLPWSCLGNRSRGRAGWAPFPLRGPVSLVHAAVCVRRAGAAPVRPYWTKYVTTDTRALIWVLDGSDRVRLAEASSALRSLLATEVRLRGAPLLVLLNKTELGGDAAVSVGEATAALGLAQPGAGGARAHHVQGCSAATGQGVAEGLQWLSSTLTATLR